MDNRRFCTTADSIRPRLINLRIKCPLPRLGFVLVLCALSAGAHAASVYRCVDGEGHIAYQDKPCPAQAQQREVALPPQPLIGAPGEHRTQAEPAPRRKTRTPRATQSTRPKPDMSWECHAANGEVFYRHTRCPSSVPGDGVVRGRYAEKMAGKRSRTSHNAWSSVPVHGTKITRSEACRRIHAAGAAGRDGHQRDASVSTYDHLMGRDPCSGQ